MKNENDLLRRDRLSEYIESFKNSGIITSDGKIDRFKYSSWFEKYVLDKKNDSISKTIDIIDDANYISKVAFEQMNATYDETLKDGGMKEDQLARFILSVPPVESTKKELLKSLDVIKETSSNPELSKRKVEIDENDDNQGDENNKKDLNKPKYDDVLVKSCLLLKPLINRLEKDDNELSSQEKIIQLQESTYAYLQKMGYSENQIKDTIEYINSFKVELDEKKKKEEKYNAYNDWRFIYYMSTLGAGYGIFYSSNESVLKVIIKELTKNDSKDKSILNNVNGNSPEREQKNIFEDKVTSPEKVNEILISLIQFKSKYHIDIEVQEIINGFGAIGTKKLFKEAFKEVLNNVYSKLEDKDIDTSKFVETYNKNVEKIMDYQGKKGLFSNYGGMRSEELYEFCIDLCDEDYNLSAKIEKELFARYGRIDKMDGDELCNVIERKFAGAYQDFLMGEDEDNKKREAVACYLLLDKTHKERDRSYRVFHPFNYSKEERIITRMKESIDSEIKEDGQDSEIRDMMRRRTVYRHGYNELTNNLRTFSLNVERENVVAPPQMERNLEVDIGEEDREVAPIEEENVIRNENSIDLKDN